jgi:hypothetical protein
VPLLASRSIDPSFFVCSLASMHVFQY